MDCGGDTAYVFIAMIVLSDENGVIKHTAESLSRAICKDVDSVRQALENLSRKDPQSNLKAHSGRRIVPLCEVNEDETRGWLVVNKQHYRDKKDLDVIRAQTRERVRRFREGNAEKRQVTVVTLCNAEKRHTDTDTDTRNTALPSVAFDAFWTAWPKHTRKGGKPECWKLWKARTYDSQVADIVRHVEAMKATKDWQKEGGEFIPAPLVYLRNRRWDGAEPPAVGGEKRMVV